MKTLIIDNYDSFAFNLFQLMGEVNGQAPVIIKNDQATWRDLAGADFDNIVISPGPGRPERKRDFGVCADAIRQAGIPLLGVCLGHQGIAYLHGGKIGHAPEPMHGRPSAIQHSGASLFAGIPSPFQATRYHSLIVCLPLPPALELTAWTPDGLPMALQHRRRPLWGVQFHPESVATEYGRALLTNFRDLTLRFLRERGGRRRFIESAAPSVRLARHGVRPGPEIRCTLRVRTLGSFLSPEQLFIAEFARKNPVFWLDSSLVKAGLSRFSFMGCASGRRSYALIYDVRNRELTVRRHGAEARRRGAFLTLLQEELARYALEGPEDLPFDFSCGFVGYLGYELKKECGAGFAHQSSVPDAALIFADRLVAFDHKERKVYLLCLEADGSDEAGRWFDHIESRIAAARTASPEWLRPGSRGGGAGSIVLEYRHPPARYLELIGQCQRKIREGESCEICLTNQVTAEVKIDPLVTYLALRSINPAPYAGFLRVGDIAILSSSPERFLGVDRSRVVEAKPIKGTMPRGRTGREDQALRDALKTSEKDRSENLTIVDLLRNDLGSICELGSVQAPRLMEVESYATVHHLVTTIRGRLRPDLTAVDAVRAAFPAGSMTGAPKIRTMEIIDRLEGAARGIYSGAIGYFALNGAADLSVTIRTIVATSAGVSFGIGGAIVALSEPREELEETFLKGRALVRALELTRLR